MNIVILSGVIAAWGIVHSLLASKMVKGFFSRALGSFVARFYRLLYNIFAVISFAPILLLMRISPDHTLYTVSVPWLFLMLAGQGLAALFLLIALLQTDALSFIGLRQISEGERSATLVTQGFYRLVRHPLYLFGLLFIWLTPLMTVNMLVEYISFTAYIFIGAYFEERKLLREFGEAYAGYKSRVPMIIPGLIFKRN